MSATLADQGTSSPAPATAKDGRVSSPSGERVGAPGLTGFNGIRRVPRAVNEPIKAYADESPEKKALKERLNSMANERIEIPIIIGGKEYRSGELARAV